MTVAELIEHLQFLPPEREVFYWDVNDGYVPVTYAEEKTNIRVNWTVKYVDGVLIV